MNDDKNLKSKTYYKIFLGIVKYTPLTLLLIKIISTILNYFCIFVPELALFGGTSIVFIFLLYLIAQVFKYCYLYKMPLYYMTSLDIFIIVFKSLIDPIDIYRIIFITFGIFMVIYIIYAYLTRNKPKVDPIKHFCERYCDC